MKDSFKLSCDLVRCPDTSFLKLIPNDRETKMAVVVGGVGVGGALCHCEGWGLLSRLCFSKMSYHLWKIDQRYKKTVLHRVWIFGSHRYTPSKNFTEYLPLKVH